MMIDLLQKAVEGAGTVLLDYFDKELNYQEKSSQHDIVTEADLASQKIIHQVLLKGMKEKGIDEKEIGFIGEEGLNIEGNHLFIIDPVDGTTNFANSFEYFAISIAYVVNGKIQSGVIYSPIEKLIYKVEKGRGVWKEINDKKVKLGIKETSLKQSLLNGHFNGPFEQRQFEIYSKMYSSVRGFRSVGSLTLDLCKFIENIFGVVINGGCYIWDVAAVNLMIKEAGGVLVDWNGKEIQFDLKNPKKSYQLIACHKKILPEVLKFF